MGRTLQQLEKDLEKIMSEIEELKKGKKIRFEKKLEIGDAFTLAGVQWKILDITVQGYHCLADKIGEDMVFSDSGNDWRKSSLRAYLNGEFLEKLAEEIGKENIIPFQRNLLSLDGQTEYGTCEDMVSLLNVDEYRKYRPLIPNTDDYWWWLITAWSTPCNKYYALVAVVSPSGNIFNYYFCNNCNGVRPFCIFSPSIFESEEE